MSYIEVHVRKSALRHEKLRVKSLEGGQSLDQVLVRDARRWKKKAGVVRASSCGICMIFADEFVFELEKRSKRLESVEKLFLGKNRLRNLRGMEVFRNVEVISLLDNDILDLAEIRILKTLPKLRSLSLAGNPLQDLPFLESHVRFILPNLEVLDGQKLPSFHSAERVVKFETATITLIAEDFCYLWSLQMTLALFKLHRELLSCTVRYPSVSQARKAARRKSHDRAWMFHNIGNDHSPSNSEIRRVIELSNTKERFDTNEVAQRLIEKVMKTRPSVVERYLRAERANKSCKNGWEFFAFEELAKAVRKEVADLLVECDLEEQKVGATRRKLSSMNAARLRAELDVEKNLRWIQERENLVSDLMHTIDVLMEAVPPPEDSIDSECLALDTVHIASESERMLAVFSPEKLF